MYDGKTNKADADRVIVGLYSDHRLLEARQDLLSL
jgi:hypothetical protein